MVNRFTISLAIAFIALLSSCGSETKDVNTTATVADDTTVVKNIKPSGSGYAKVNGLEMYYEVYGEGKPLVLIHGSFMNIISNWSAIIPSLAKNRKVIVAEMQAHGRTKDIPRAFSYEAMADDVSGLLKHLKIDSADVLGYSMGGGVAFQFAIRHPEQLRRLVILSSAYAHDGWWPDVEASFPTFTPEMFMGTPIQKQYDSLGNDPARFGDFIRKVMSVDVKTYDWSKEVKNIKSPIFYLIGDADGIRYEHALELFRAKGGGKMGDIHGMPTSRLAILPGTTHIGIITNSHLWEGMVKEFLDGDLNAAPPSF